MVNVVENRKKSNVIYDKSSYVAANAGLAAISPDAEVIISAHLANSLCIFAGMQLTKPFLMQLLSTIRTSMLSPSKPT